MAKDKKQQKANERRLVLKVNLKAVAILAGVLGLLVIGYFPIRSWTDQASRKSALDQVRASIEGKDVDLALRKLDRYLAAWPGDIEAMDIQAKLLADTARSIDQLLRAANANDQLLRLDPEGEDRQETRRRLILLYIRYGDMVRAVAEARNEQNVSAFEVRYRAAVTIGRQLLAKGAKDDATSQRLLAMALDGVANGGDAEALKEAVGHYEAAIKLDPTDAVSAERLATIDLLKRNDRPAAEKTLDALLKAKPGAVDVRMARFRYFTRAKQEDRARAELEAAVQLAPLDVTVLTTIASDALQHRDPVTARRYLDAIPKADQDGLRVRTLRGMLEFAELKPNEAVDQWRRGLTLTGGSDVELTWQLAYALIHLNRLADAKPLVTQFERLDAEDRRGMGRFLRAMYEHRSGHAAKAIDGLERIRDRVPDVWRVDLQLTLGLAYEAMGDSTRAMTAFRRASALSPQLAGPHREIARLLKQTSPQEALAELDQALLASPGDLDLLLEAGRLRFNAQLALPLYQRRWNEVEEIVGRLDKLAPANPAVQLLKADYLVTTGKLDQAVSMLEQGTHGAGRDRVEAWTAYATALERQGRRAEAIRVLEEASQPAVAGDHSAFRVARARLLARSGRGQAAREALTANLDNVPKPERADLARARGDLARELADRSGARDAYAEWARLQPDSPRPGLMLMELASSNNDDDAARLGLEALRSIGGEDEPYGLAARAMELIRSDRGRPGAVPDRDRLDEADRLVKRLEETAPNLAVGPLIRGLILERRDQPAEAAAAYKLALKDTATIAATLPRLVDVLVKLGKYDDLTALKQQYGEGDRAASFDQMMTAAALRAGDKGQAEITARQLAEASPENVGLRIALATLLDESGKTADALASLRELVGRLPNDASAWCGLISFEARRGAPGEAAKTAELLRSTYKGDRPELVYARGLRLSGNIAAAGRAYDDAVSRRPDDMQTLFVAVEFDEANGRPAESEAALRRALRIDPKTGWAARTLAVRLASKPGEAAWNEAWALIAPGAPAAGDTPEDRMIRATVLSRSPDIARRAEVIPTWTRLVEDLPPSNPVGSEARGRLSQIMLDINRPADAARYIEPVADDTSRPNPNALAIGVEAQVRNGKVDEAERRLDRLVSLEPKEARTAAARAWVLSGRGKMAEAVAVVEAAVADVLPKPGGDLQALALRVLLTRLNQAEAIDRLDRLIASKLPRLAYLHAQDLLRHRDYDGALAQCRIAADAGSTPEALQVATGIALARASDPSMLKQVDSLIESIVPATPKTPDILVMVATIRHLEQRYVEEIAAYREAIDAKPANYRFENNMAWTLSEALNKPGDALGRVDDVIRREGRNPAYLDTRGVILTRLGQYEEAIIALKESLRGAASPTTYFHLARVYRKSGNQADYQQNRDLAIKAKFDRSTLDPTDKADLDEVMGTR